MEPQVVIADDEPHLLLLLEQALEKLEDEGVEIHTATNGADALALVQELHPELIILDVMMPKMNGFDVCRAIKGDPELQSTFVILLTAKGQQADRVTGTEAGADLYITKPFNPQRLRDRAAQVLGLELD